MGRETLVLTVTKAVAGHSLDRAIEALAADLSRSRAQKLIRRGDVKLDGKRIVRSNGKVQTGMRIAIERERPETPVVFQDDDILVVVKPAGLLTHAADRSDGDDLAAELNVRFGPLPDSRGVMRAGIVHRLDRETSGLLVIARTEAALETLQLQFRERTPEKAYLALVSGIVPAEPFTCNEPLGPVPGTMDRQGVDHENGKDARTDVRCLEAYARHSLVECTIHTGRRHQIRVHLTEAGYPVLGDALYGTKRAVTLPSGAPPVPRLALHAGVLGFDHPSTGERMRFEAPLPADLARVAAALGKR